jgi:RNA polymerase sigma factor (sigma-70 family)
MIQVAGLLARWYASRVPPRRPLAAPHVRAPPFTPLASALKHPERISVPSGVEPVTSPLEAVDAAGAHRTALADALVVAAWTEHHGEIFAFLVRTTRDPLVAEDLLAEAYLRLTREARAGRTPDNVRAWLYRVGANLAVSRGRRLAAAFRGIARIRSTGVPSTTAVTPEAGYLQREGRAALLAVLADLDPGARAALLLASEGFSGVEIAAAIGRSEAATRTLLCRTRMRVRSRLESAEAVP